MFKINDMFVLFIVLSLDVLLLFQMIFNKVSVYRNICTPPTQNIPAVLLARLPFGILLGYMCNAYLFCK